MRGSNKQWDYKLGKPMGVTYIFVYNFQRYLYLVHVITLYYNVVKAQHACLLMLSVNSIIYSNNFQQYIFDNAENNAHPPQHRYITIWTNHVIR